MAATEEAFKQAETEWDLARLYRDLTSAKQQLGKKRKLTPVEMACLRGLLCGCSPPEIATELQREPRGLRVDLSRGLYRYVEILTDRPPNALKDWRDVTDWLTEANYRIGLDSLSALEDSPLKIVDVVLRRAEDSPELPVIDIKVRNTGDRVAFLKKAKFLVYKAWVLHGLVFREPTQAVASAPAAPTQEAARSVMSRAVESSYDYQFSLPKIANYQTEFFQKIFSTDCSSYPYCEEFNISQCVAGNDVDRFTLTVTLAKELLETDSSTYKSTLYHLKLELIYDEDNKAIQSPDLVLWLEPNSPLGVTRYFLEEDDPQQAPLIREYSQHNRQVLAEVAQISGIKSATLNRFLDKLAIAPAATPTEETASSSLLNRLAKKFKP